MSLGNLLLDIEERLEIRIRSLERRIDTLEKYIHDPEGLTGAVEKRLADKILSETKDADRIKN